MKKFNLGLFLSMLSFFAYASNMDSLDQIEKKLEESLSQTKEELKKKVPIKIKKS